MPCPSEHLRSRLLVSRLRELTGLPDRNGLHPEPQPFYRQDEAVAAWHRLVESDDYNPWQIGVFAQEVGEGGKRKFMVDTFAGFAMDHAPGFRTSDMKPQGNVYEVILETRPCWLYFDLEYARESNPDLDPEVAMTAFRETLTAFCKEVLGMAPDTASTIELESSTPKKFSKHVLVRQLQGSSDQEVKNLAFANNAQAGLVVAELIAFASARRQEPESLSRHLFVRSPPSASTAANSEPREVCLIDESVYSRNRSFRLLFQSKFGKDVRLDLNPDLVRKAFNGRMPPPSIALLQTMVSFVPKDTEFFQHEIIPPGFGHAAAKASRLSRGGTVGVGSAGGGVAVVQSDALLHHLVAAWDEVRKNNEPGVPSPLPTVVQSCVEMDRRFWTVTLSNNRFCFCKGSSHTSNHIYLVVDRDRSVYHQKCFDPDCRGFGSPTFEIPEWLIETAEEEEDLSTWLGSQGAAQEAPSREAKRLRSSEGGA